jgi:hypothetical protein
MSEDLYKKVKERMILKGEPIHISDISEWLEMSPGDATLLLKKKPKVFTHVDNDEWELVKKSDKRKLERIEQSFVEEDDMIYEQVWDKENGSRYITLNGTETKFYDHVSEYFPIESEAINKGIVVLPDGVEDYGDITKLVNEIQEHIHKYLDISEDMKIFSAFYIIFSWVHDKTTTLNYMRFLGDWGTGKSRALDVVGRLCYKPLLVFGALTPAVVYRMLDFWGGTLIIDEADFKQSDEQADIIKILNAGFEKSRSAVARCNPNDCSIIDTFQVYGTKIIASRKTWRDQALESRCLTERMMRTSRKDIVPILDKEYFEAENILRRKLLKFRLDYYDKIEYKYHDLGIPDLEPRLKQAVASFSVLFHNIPELMTRFRKFIKKYNEDLIEERSSSYEGMIIQSFCDMLSEGYENIQSKEIAERMKNTFGSEFSAVSVGKSLKSMGFDIKIVRTSDGLKRAIKFNIKTLLTVVERYLPATSATRVTLDKNVTGVTDVTVYIGGLVKSVTNKENKQGSYTSTLTPTGTVTNVTSVTNTLKKIPVKDGISKEDLFLSLKLDKIMKDSQKEEFEGIVQKLLREGQIFEPNPGHLQKVE